jgi:hypothetical protein
MLASTVISSAVQPQHVEGVRNPLRWLNYAFIVGQSGSQGIEGGSGHAPEVRDVNSVLRGSNGEGDTLLSAREFLSNMKHRTSLHTSIHKGVQWLIELSRN